MTPGQIVVLVGAGLFAASAFARPRAGRSSLATRLDRAGTLVLAAWLASAVLTFPRLPWLDYGLMTIGAMLLVAGVILRIRER